MSSLFLRIFVARGEDDEDDEDDEDVEDDEDDEDEKDEPPFSRWSDASLTLLKINDTDISPSPQCLLMQCLKCVADKPDMTVT